LLTEFFAPRGIAVVGTSRDPKKVGHAVFANLLAGDYSGPVYPVNPSAPDVLGHPTFASLSVLPSQVDLVVVVVPAAIASGVIRECGMLGIPAAIVISAGFRETGPAGAILERELVSAAREGGVRVLGPNCLGLIASRAGINASFAPIMPSRGNIAFLSQSGALGTAILDWAAGEGIGLSHFVSLGNKADLSEVDLVRAWSTDPDCGVVVAYLESISDGAGFVSAVSELVKRAPFIALTAGSSEAGARAVSSHTGSLAGSRAAYAAAFRKAGAIAAGTVQELFDFAEGFARQPLPGGPGTVILTNAGGPAILATDACEQYGVTLAKLDGDTERQLRDVLPAAASVYNPVDILGDAPAARYADAARIILRDPNVNSLIVVLTPQAMTDPEQTALSVSEAVRDSGVTTLAVFMGDATVASAMQVFKEAGIPGYSFPERAVGTLGAMERYRVFREAPPSDIRPVDLDSASIRSAIDHAREAHRTFITEASAQRIAEACGIDTPQAAVATDLAQARDLAARFGYPVVLKIASPDILHKSDIGGIALDLADDAAVTDAYEQIIARVLHRMPEARIWGVTVQKQLPPAREVIIGVNRDANFGPILMFGLGGIYVEVLRDVTFRLCPVTLSEAHEMISEIRAIGLLRGARGAAPADIDAIADVITKVSALVMEFDDITELDINPLIVGDRGQGAVAADIRIGIGG
jgi:acetyltransferase